VHISMMSHKFVKDPHEVVKAGEVVKVKVLEVDQVRRRIGLTMKLEEAPRPRADVPRQEGHERRERRDGRDAGGRRPGPRQGPQDGPGQRPGDRRPQAAARPPREREPQGNGVMAEALAKAFKR